MGIIFDNMQMQLHVKDVLSSASSTIIKKSDETKVATEEQNLSFTEISKAIFNINEISQNNAAVSEELSGTSEQLAGLSDEINNDIEFFNV